MFCVYFCVLVCVCKFMSWLTFPDERASIRVWGVRTCLVCPCWVCQLNVVKRFLNDRVSKSTMFHTTVWYCGHQFNSVLYVSEFPGSQTQRYTTIALLILYTTQMVLAQFTRQPAISISLTALWISVIQSNPSNSTGTTVTHTQLILTTISGRGGNWTKRGQFGDLVHHFIVCRSIGS